MADEAWNRFVADFCLARGLVTAGQVERLKASEFCFLAGRQFLLGAHRLFVIRLLERAAAETAGGEE